LIWVAASCVMVSKIFFWPAWLVMRPTALSSLGRLVTASSRVFGCASRTYQ